jgi:hypothetical protein
MSETRRLPRSSPPTCEGPLSKHGHHRAAKSGASGFHPTEKLSVAPSMAGVGHEDAFPRPRLSARSRFSQGTFAGTRGNGRDAPKAAVRCTAASPAPAFSLCDKT